MSQRVAEASEALRGILVNFMPNAQRRALIAALRSEEGECIADLVLGAVRNIRATPLTYQTESVEMKDKVLHLHYFGGGIDAWIVERDVGDTPDQNGEGPQLQAYGKITLFGGGWDEAEWGYISIADLIANGVELDFYWEAKTVKEMERGG